MLSVYLFSFIPFYNLFASFSLVFVLLFPLFGTRALLSPAIRFLLSFAVHAVSATSPCSSISMLFPRAECYLTIIMDNIHDVVQRISVSFLGLHSVRFLSLHSNCTREWAYLHNMSIFRQLIEFIWSQR